MKRVVSGAVFALTLTPVLYLRLCNVLFRCGCTWFFAGGSSHCNIHNALPPHCPICAAGTAAAVLFGALIAGALFGATMLLAPRSVK